jgi:hypothetical protein
MILLSQGAPKTAGTLFSKPEQLRGRDLIRVESDEV